MNTQIEEGIRTYAKAQLAAQDTPPTGIPDDEANFMVGSSPKVFPERDPVMIFEIPNDLEHLCETLHLGILEQSVKTPRLEAGTDSIAQLARHENIIRAASNRQPPEGGANGRVWFESTSNIAAISAAVEASAGYSIAAWFWMNSSKADDENDFVHVARIKIRLIEI